MRVLLDTHILLWALGEPDKLDPSTRSLLADASNTVLFSVASIWDPRPPPQSWLDALERGRADIAAGRTYALEDVLAELDASIAEMEAEQQERDEADAPEP